MAVVVVQSLLEDARVVWLGSDDYGFSVRTDRFLEDIKMLSAHTIYCMVLIYSTHYSTWHTPDMLQDVC